MNSDSQLRLSVASLLKEVGEDAENLTITTERRGGNNQSYRIYTNGKYFFLKKYFSDEVDKRDRLKTEIAFLEYAKNVATNYVPKVFGFDENEKIGIYEYIDGQSILTNQLDESAINSSIKFFLSKIAVFNSDCKRSKSILFSFSIIILLVLILLLIVKLIIFVED